MACGSTYSTQLRAYLHSQLEYHNIDKHDWITGNWIHFPYLLERRKKIVLCAVLVVNCAWYKFWNVFFCIHLCRRRFFAMEKLKWTEHIFKFNSSEFFEDYRWTWVLHRRRNVERGGKRSMKKKPKVKCSVWWFLIPKCRVRWICMLSAHVI